MREDERKDKEHSKDFNMSLKVWERSKKEVLSASERLREIVGDEKILKLSDVVKAESDASKLLIPRRQEKENTTDFIAKKREMFLVQMSLDTKREEIRKLEEKAQLKEDALQRSEQMLEEDANRFDSFLKENDKKAHDAIKKAEEETKRKQEKSHEIKRLTQQIQAVNSEMSKHREALEDCLRYKSFLDMLTPTEWFEQHQQRHQEKVDKIKQDSFKAKHKEWDRLRRKLTEAHRKEVEIKRELKNKEKKKSRVVVEDEDEEEEEIKLVIPPAPRLEDEIVDIPRGCTHVLH